MLVPGSANPLLLRSAAAAATGISRSLRFNSSDSAYLSRTPASAGNRKTWTWAGWVKRSGTGAVFDHIFIGSLVTDAEGIRFNSSNKIQFYLNGGSFAANLITTQVFRDFSAWYHIVVAVDTTQATASNRVKLYINGTQITVFDTSTYPSQNYDCPAINTTAVHWIGANIAGPFYSNFYLADIHFIDGQALTPSSFTETDATTGQLIPKAFSGSYGSQGWHLEFADNSSNTATTLGKDTSGNGNNWTPNNLSVTAGAGNDSLVDVPTNGAQTDTGAGGEVRGNYCTWNPLKKVSSATAVNGNLAFTVPNDGGIASTFAVSSGKWYWEVVLSSGRTILGLATTIWDPAVYPGNTAQGWGYSAFNGNKIHNASSTSYGSSFTTGDVIGVAFNADAGTLTFYKNGTSQGQAFTGITGSVYQPALGGDGGTTGAGDANFGQRPFAYTAPSGFKALCTANLPAPVVTKPSTVFNAIAYNGNSSTNTLPLDFGADLIWVKNRGITANHYIADVVRGTDKILASNNTEVESTNAGFISSISNTGVTLGSGSFVANYNQSGNSYAGWFWDAGSSTVTNTQGSISSQVRANTSAGFSIVTYTGSGANSTIGHGLGVPPQFIITKNRSSSAFNWGVYHASAGNTGYLKLNLTDAFATQATWQNTTPTSTVFYVGNFNSANQGSDNYVAYCFAPVAGYSSFGSYTGNGSADGPFVYTGFRPRYVLQKKTSDVSAWAIRDAARDPYNAANTRLWTNFSSAESSADAIDILSNGFKVRNTDTDWNASGATYIYAAFAESPFQYARAR